MQLPQTMFHLSPMWLDASIGSVKKTPCLLTVELAIFETFLFVVFILLLFSPLSTVSMMTRDPQVNQSQL